MESAACAICRHLAADPFVLDQLVGPAVCRSCALVSARLVLEGQLDDLEQFWPCSRRLTAAIQLSFKTGEYDQAIKSSMQNDPFLNELRAADPTGSVLSFPPDFEAWSLVECAEAILNTGKGARYRALDGQTLDYFLQSTLGSPAVELARRDGDLRPAALLAVARTLLVHGEHPIHERAAKLMFRPPLATEATLERLRTHLFRG